jgi:hypothetical protein
LERISRSSASDKKYFMGDTLESVRLVNFLRPRAFFERYSEWGVRTPKNKEFESINKMEYFYDEKMSCVTNL